MGLGDKTHQADAGEGEIHPQFVLQQLRPESGLFNWILHQFSLMHCEERGRRRRAVVQPRRQLWRKMQLHLAAELALAFPWLYRLCSRLGKRMCKRKGLE